MKCKHCPVAEGKPCLGKDERFAQFCEWAESKDPWHCHVIVSRSAFEEKIKSNADSAQSPAYPSVAEQAANAASAVVRFAASGGATVDDAERDRRLAICHSCDQFDKSQGRCFKCGCVTSWKARLETEHCPIEKW